MTDSNDAPQTAIKGTINWIGQLDEKGNPIGPNLAQPASTDNFQETADTSLAAIGLRDPHTNVVPGNQSSAEPVVNTPLRARLRLALMNPNTRALSLYRRRDQAHDAMEDDMRTLASLGFGPHLNRSAAHMRIRIENGSEIRYIAGDEHRLEEQLRGMRCDHLDGRSLISPEVAFWLTGKRED